MVEQITTEQMNAAQNALQQNKALLQQQANIASAEAMKLAKDALDELNATLTELPYKAEEIIIEIRDKLMALIYGEPINPESFDYDAILKATIAQLQQLITPVVSGLTSISIPLPPPLADLNAILSQLGSIKLPTSDDIKSTATASADAYKSQLANLTDTVAAAAEDAANQVGAAAEDAANQAEAAAKEAAAQAQAAAEQALNDIKNSIPDIKPELDPKLKQAILDIQSALITLSQQLPTLIENLIVQMLCNIYDMFMEIAGIIGVPSIPAPFSLIKQVPNVLLDVYMLSKSLPGKMKNIAESIARSKMAEIQALKNSVPPAPMSLCATGNAVEAISPVPLAPKAPEEDKDANHVAVEEEGGNDEKQPITFTWHEYTFDDGAKWSDKDLYVECNYILSRIGDEDEDEATVQDAKRLKRVISDRGGIDAYIRKEYLSSETRYHEPRRSIEDVVSYTMTVDDITLSEMYDTQLSNNNSQSLNCY